MATTYPLGQRANRLPTNFLSLPSELRQKILLNIIDAPSQDLFPEAGKYEDGRTDTWYDEYHILLQEIEILSAKLKQCGPRTIDDVEYVRMRWTSRLSQLNESWLWNALIEGPERWEETKDWEEEDDDNSAPDTQTTDTDAHNPVQDQTSAPSP